MSIHPTEFYEDGSMYVVYDEQQHEGIVTLDQLLPAAPDLITGIIDPTIKGLPCPDGCGDISWHPIGGGADPPNVQEMYVRNFVAREGMTPIEAIELVKKEIARTDPGSRWAVPSEREAVLRTL